MKAIELEFFKHREGQWLEEYRCGCSTAVFKKDQLPRFCPKHQESRRHPPIKICKGIELELVR